MARPVSNTSELSHLSEKTDQSRISSQPSARGSPVTPSHHTWRAFSGPVLFTDSAEPDEMQHDEAFHLDLHCSPRSMLAGIQRKKVKGPSGLRDHRTSTQHEFQMVGEVARSTEVTSQLGYLNRTPPGQEFPKAKNGQAGEIGWLYDTHKVVKGI